MRSYSQATDGGSLGSKFSPASRRGVQSILLLAIGSPCPPPSPLVFVRRSEITGHPHEDAAQREGGGDSEAGDLAVRWRRRARWGTLNSSVSSSSSAGSREQTRELLLPAGCAVIWAAHWDLAPGPPPPAAILLRLPSSARQPRSSGGVLSAKRLAPPLAAPASARSTRRALRRRVVSSP